MSDKKVAEENGKIDLDQIEKALIQSDPKVFEGIKTAKKEQIIKSFVLSMHKTHSGPLPDPETLKDYSTLIPNGAERIMAMAEKQANHRMDMEKRVINGQMTQSNIGQFLAFFIGIAALSAATICILKGHEWAGGIIGLSGITGLVTAFIQGRKNQERDLQQKSPQQKTSRSKRS